MTTYQQKLAIDTLNHLCALGQQAINVNIYKLADLWCASLTIREDYSGREKNRNAFGFTEDSAIENLYRIVTGKPLESIGSEVVQE